MSGERFHPAFSCNEMDLRRPSNFPRSQPVNRFDRGTAKVGLGSARISCACRYDTRPECCRNFLLRNSVGGAALDQLGNRRRVFQDRSWPALRIEQLEGRIDAQALVDGRMNVLWLERASVRAIALGVGRTDDLAAADAATAQEAEHRVAPVVAAGRAHAAGRAAVAAVVHAGRAAELAA